MITYNWRHVAVIYDSTNVLFDIAGSKLVTELKRNPEMSDFAEILTEARTHARVFMLFCNSYVLRDILYRAYYRGMAGGDHAFITMDLFPSDGLDNYMNFIRGDETDSAVTKAYESFLLLTLRQPNNPEYKAFAAEVKLRARRDYGYEFAVDESVHYIITAFYDSAIYLALSYRTVLDEGGDIHDGFKVAQRLWNSTFQGSRMADFDLFDMTSPLTRTFRMVGRFRGATQSYVPTEGVSIVWPEELPFDMPPCGFSGELCPITAGKAGKAGVRELHHGW